MVMFHVRLAPPEPGKSVDKKRLPKPVTHLSESTSGASGNSAYGLQAVEDVRPERRQDMLVFREEAHLTSVHDLARPLRDILERIDPPFRDDREQVVEGLLRAGELECALADAGSEIHANAALLTDSLAETLL